MSEQLWATILSAIPDVERWNTNIKRLLLENDESFAKVVYEEANRRGYLYSAESNEWIHPWDMRATKGPKVIGVGYRAGQLALVFAAKDGPRRFESVNRDIPMELANKLLSARNTDAAYLEHVKGKIELLRVR